MASEMKTALRDWFSMLQNPAEAHRAGIVTGNLPELVTVKPMPMPGIGGVIVMDVTHTSTS
jgi:hypothetical protein